MSFELIDIVGYLASIILMCSFLMKDVMKLRIVNSVACGLFVVYGLMLGSWPVVISNGFILCVNLWYLLKTGPEQQKKA